MKFSKQLLVFCTLLACVSTSAMGASTTCYHMDVKTANGKEHGFGFPTKFKESDNQVGFILADKKITIPPFTSLSSSF